MHTRVAHSELPSQRAVYRRRSAAYWSKYFSVRDPRAMRRGTMVEPRWLVVNTSPQPALFGLADHTTRSRNLRGYLQRVRPTSSRSYYPSLARGSDVDPSSTPRTSPRSRSKHDRRDGGATDVHATDPPRGGQASAARKRLEDHFSSTGRRSSRETPRTWSRSLPQTVVTQTRSRSTATTDSDGDAKSIASFMLRALAVRDASFKRSPVNSPRPDSA